MLSLVSLVVVGSLGTVGSLGFCDVPRYRWNFMIAYVAWALAFLWCPMRFVGLVMNAREIHAAHSKPTKLTFISAHVKGNQRVSIKVHIHSGEPLRNERQALAIMLEVTKNTNTCLVIPPGCMAGSSRLLKSDTSPGHQKLAGCRTTLRSCHSGPNGLLSAPRADGHVLSLPRSPPESQSRR